MPAWPEALVCLGSLNARPEDRSLSRAELEPFQWVVDGSSRPLRSLCGLGELGVSSLATAHGRVYLTDGSRLYELADAAAAPEPIALPGLEDVHEMEAIGGHLWLANTAHNELVCFDPVTRTVLERLGLPNASAAADAKHSESHYHVNQCFAGAGGELLALVHHVDGKRSLSRLKRRVAQRIKSQGNGGIIDPRSGEVRLGGLHAPHSVRRVSDGSWILCDSGRFELHHYDPSWRLIRRLDVGGWSRGVALGRDHVYVGISETRRRYRGLLPGSTWGSNCVLAIEAKGLSIVERIPVSQVEQINNVYVASAELSAWASARDGCSFDGREAPGRPGRTRDRERSRESA